MLLDTRPEDQKGHEVMKPIIIAMTLAAALAAYAILDSYECWVNAGTDLCVECTDDCLDGEVQAKVQP